MNAKSEVRLTPDQAKIAEHRDGPMIVLAGAGSGKTATLVERVGHLIPKGVSPSSILLLTFSRKAATEIKARLAARFDVDGESVVVDTFHGFGFRFLRENKALFDMDEDDNWAILTENDQRRMLNELAKPLLEKNNIEGRKFRKFLGEKFRQWSLLKQDCKLPGNQHDALKALAEAQQRQTGEQQMKLQPWDYLAADVLLAYEKEKREGGYLDYDDLLLHTVKALIKNPAVALDLSFRHSYMMVDESQDTNLVQYLMVRQIGKNHGNVVMVGDDDQSIYGWRGARVANLRRFISDFGASTVRLEQNFRSPSSIVNGARNLISNNQARLPKNPFSANEHGELPSLRAAETDRDMAWDIVRDIQAKYDAGVPLRDIAVLYRTNRMTQVLEPALKRAGLPYVVVGGMSFYERAEIQTVLACVRISSKPDDWQAMMSLQPYIDGVGKKGLKDVIDNLKDADKTLLDLALCQGDAARQYGKAGLTLQRFAADMFLNAVIDNAGETAGDKAEFFVQWMKDGPMKILDREKDETLRLKREQNLEQLVHEIRESETDDWLDYLLESPISDYIASKEGLDCLTLSTVHRSKGLEWPHVMIAGFSEGLMPFEPQRLRGESAPKENEEDDEDGGRPEEERRLCYVAMTRAEQDVTFYHANLYRFPGSEPAALALSPYAREIGLEITPDAAEVLSAYDDDYEDTSVSSGLFGRLGVA